MELLAELAARFPKHGDPADEKPRLRLLAEDLSETMSSAELAAAIKVGRKTWRFLPTLAEIVEAGADYRAERRDRQREAEQARLVADLHQPALPAPSADLEAERAALMAETMAKLDAGVAKLLRRDLEPPAEPLSWRIMRESGRNVSPQLEAWRDEMFAR
jgi:hypothetical protein